MPGQKQARQEGFQKTQRLEAEDEEQEGVQGRGRGRCRGEGEKEEAARGEEEGTRKKKNEETKSLPLDRLGREVFVWLVKKEKKKKTGRKRG